MAFEALSNRLNKAIRNISGKGKLSESNMDEMLQEVKMSLLEADVNYRVVKEFIAKIREKALGTEVMDTLNPGQMVVKVVHDELVELLGNEETKIKFKEDGITSIMMVGLQGTGKTTSIAKIANVLKKKEGRSPLLVACDIIRPAAIDQLITLGKSIGVEVFSLGASTGAIETVEKALVYAKEKNYDTVLIDTAGRLHIDEELMNELANIAKIVVPEEILLSVDAMTGQDIVSVATSFKEQLNITGLVVTKADGDSRGGGVLSVRSITNVPVKFVGQGEKIEDLDIFYPDRMADRILGMGDIMSLVEQAQDKMDTELSEKSANRIMNGIFTMDDMLDQFKQLKKMGSMSSMLKMIPGMNKLAGSINDNDADKTMKKSEAIILSMTKEERNDPSIIRTSRKTRIANGSGTNATDVNRLIAQYEKAKVAMKQVGSMAKNGQTPDMSNMMNMAKAAGTKKFVSKLGKKKFK
ncbi:MAG: signal recognition particle protein [Erysipelotrichaceae bacterium]